MQMGLVLGNKGVGTWIEGGRFYNRASWDYGGGLALIWLGSGAHLCCVGSKQ